MSTISAGSFNLCVRPDLPEEIGDVPEGWESVFYEYRDELQLIFDNLREKNQVYYPPKSELFQAFRLCPLNKCRVVIVGMDPYPGISANGVTDACGVAFGIRPNQRYIPKSLQNIFLCIKKCYKEFRIPNHGDLTRWCEQGILLLNMCLVYFPNMKISSTQRRFCMSFISRVIEKICDINPEVIFVLWGKDAKDSITLPAKIRRLYGIHPSSKNGNAFVETVNHFREINDMLVSSNQEPIDWTL